MKAICKRHSAPPTTGAQLAARRTIHVISLAPICCDFYRYRQPPWASVGQRRKGVSFSGVCSLHSGYIWVFWIHNED